MRPRRVIPLVTTAVVTMASLGSACGQDDGTSADPASSPVPTVAAERPTSSAELTIVSPANGDRIAGDTAQLEIDLQGAEVVDQTSTDLQPDEGHLHVMLDGTLVSMASSTSQRIGELTPGPHLVQVEFVADDHAPFDPRVLAAVTFEVKA